MPANAKWPDFQLASRLRYFMGSSAPESTPSQITSSPQLNEARREESPSAQDNDLEAESHARSAAMAEIDNEPIEEMGDVDDYEHEGDDTGVDVDFGDLEMFDSNASQLPFLSQEPQSLKTEEPVFPTSSESTKRDKTKKKKKKKSPLQTDEIAGDTPTEADLDAPRATLASEESIGGPDAVEDATTDMDALDLKPILSTQKKKKRKTSESADGKRHKKRKGLEDGDTNTIQQTQDENLSSQLLGVAAEDGQMSPSIALARRRSQTGEETRSRENSVPRAQVAPMAPMAIDTSAPEPAPEEASRSQEATTENHRDDRDVEDLAREAWREHVNSQSGNATAANKIEPASQDSAEAEEQPDATPRRRSARTKKPKPTLPAEALESTETPAKKSRRILEELPSPSANTPKPRARAKRATQKPRQQTEQTSEDDFENAESEKPAKRATNLEGYTQGRFTDAEFDGINRAIEAFRNEYGLTQVQINEVKPPFYHVYFVQMLSFLCLN